jgi:hypothetical protein
MRKLLGRKGKVQELVQKNEIIGSPEYQLIMRLEELLQEFEPESYIFGFKLDTVSFFGGQGTDLSALLETMSQSNQTQVPEAGLGDAKEE